MVEMKTHGKKTVEGELITAAAHHECAVQRLPGTQDFHPDRLEKHSTIQPEHLYNTLISMEQNRQLLPESLDDIAYIDMFFMPNNGMALLSSRLNLSESIYPLASKHCHRQAYMTIGFKKMMARFMSFAVVNFATVLGSSVSANFGQSLEQCTGSLHRNTENIQNNPALEVTKVHLAGTSLVVSWNEGYVGSSNGVHALKFIPQLLQVYFDVALQDMSNSLLCTLLPMVFFRIKAMFPDKAFSIEVSLSYLFEVVIPKEVKTLQKPITSQPQTSDSKVAQSHQLLKKTVWRRIEDHHCCLRLSPWSGEAGDEYKDGPCLAAYTA
ncbi:hypothetical protein SELMODRAFT_414429 [Selaginella moellendorffii]|uniref:Uncharacterized protein n=1 Tax=Selaginella moellendorffii TaxID=88036 RepID=D8RSQ7_SELML|nr:hypothetical protein SELMODRAFT_414429 [Selaginella moellendorffii]